MHDFDKTYIDELHIQAFAFALRNDDHLPDLDSRSSSNAASPTSSTSTIRSSRVRRVSAMSDFAPIQVRVKKRRKDQVEPDKRQELLFIILRWPLLLFLFLFIFIVFGAYVSIRQCVNTWERLFAWRGHKGVLRRKLRAAQTYKAWKAAAEDMDAWLKFDRWKHVEASGFYDWRLVSRVRRSLKTSRETDDVRTLTTVLNTCMRSNFAGTESTQLYSETFYGTKDLIESYIDEVQAALAHVRTSNQMSLEEKRQFFKSCNVNLGSSALCLSGGATFGYYHFGIVKALLDSDLLPRVIAGTSAGGLVAALVCTRTDDELRELLVPELAGKLSACEEPLNVWMDRLRRTGARFDTVDWARKACYFTRGSLTFKEAWVRTGRVLNVSVIPFDRHSPTKLLNYLTAPDTVIWSALIASAAVPGIMNPVVLMQKTPIGNIIPWSWGSRFKDGSLRYLRGLIRRQDFDKKVDIPLQALNLYFNVTHPIVSQVNPHVHLFFFAPKGSPGKPVAHTRGKGWRGGFLLSAAEQWLKLELTKNFKFIRDLELLPQLLGQDWSSVFLQRFDGAVTIWPRTRLKDWLRILSDPDEKELEQMIRAGEIATWPKIHIIGNRFRLEREVLFGRQFVRRALQREKPMQDTDVGQPVGPTRKAMKGLIDELPIESEAERDFSQGSHRFFKRTRSRIDKVLPETHRLEPTGPNQTTSALNAQDRLRPQSRRLFSYGADDEAGTVTQSPSSPPSPKLKSTTSFFSRLRTKSFASLPSALVGGRQESIPTVKNWANEHDEEWSSDSESNDEKSETPLSGGSIGSPTTRRFEQNALGLQLDGGSNSGSR